MEKQLSIIPSEEDFFDYLYHICNGNEELIALVDEFYDLLGKQDKINRPLTRKNFSGLKTPQKYYTADIEYNIFLTQDTLTRQELFRYNFLQFVNDIDFVKNLASGVADYVYGSKSIRVNDVTVNSVKRFREKFGKEKFSIDEAVSICYEARKNHLFHELCHVLEIKTYAQGSIIQIGSSTLYEYATKSDLYSHWNEASMEARKMLERGVNRLSETINEITMLDLIGRRQTANLPTEIIRDYDLKSASGKVMETVFPKGVRNRWDYHANFDIVAFLGILGVFPDVFNPSDNAFVLEEMRLNPTKIIEKINDLKVTDGLKESLLKTLPNLSPEDAKVYKNINNYDFICLCIGSSTDETNQNYLTTSVKDIYNQGRIAVQTLLIDAYNHRLARSLVYNRGYATTTLLRNVDEQLDKINSVLVKPFKEGKVTGKRENVNTIRDFPISRLVLESAQQTNISAFNQSLKIFKSYIRRECPQDYESVFLSMPYLNSEIRKNFEIGNKFLDEKSKGGVLCNILKGR